MRNKTILMTLIIAMTFLIGFSAQGAFAGSPIVYQEPLDGEISGRFGSTTPIADDFVIDIATTITDFHVLLAPDPDAFDGFVQYAIYEDDNGLPGALVPDGSGVGQGDVFGDPFPCGGQVCYEFGADLEIPVPLEPGTYWIEFSGVTNNWGVPLDNVIVGSEAAAFFGIWLPISEIFGIVGVSFSITGEVDLPPPDPTIEKTLVLGPEQIGISLPGPTAYVYTIEYSGPAALVKDTVPAEFEVLSAVSGDDSVTITNQGKGPKSQGATTIEWQAPAGTSTLIVAIQTVESPGKGHKLDVFKPTSCGPLAINDGATAFEVDANGDLVLVEFTDPATGVTTLVPVVIVGPSNSLEVEAVEGAKACIEVEIEIEVD